MSSPESRPDQSNSVPEDPASPARADADAGRARADAAQARTDAAQARADAAGARADAAQARADAGRVPSGRADDVPPDDAPEQPRAAGRRKNPIGPVVLLVLAAAALWAASRMTWVTITSSDGLTEPATHRLDGGVWFGALTPVALVLLAGVAAVFATRGWLRRLVGVVVALLAAVAAVPGFALLTQHGRTAERAATLAQLPARAHVDHVTTAAFPAALSLIGAVLAFLAGVLLARMPEATARLSGKYDNPVFRRAAAAEQVARQRGDVADAASATSGQTPAGAAESGAPQAGSASKEQLSERVLWDALDAGADPTDDEAERDR
ncbi:Trp biosynthesis-associated membrane protein [Nocardia miyunensis]|uniref:Trp biosynthesis-associated membrane protein n=1 Tax=Nocardia miyunensis TaxID=282684 RepID=UPI000A065A4B|nr:Trp biosynthesis-associated membrane protein [Nocardia miyunensis]